jgi:hypothetical protein
MSSTSDAARQPRAISASDWTSLGSKIPSLSPETAERILSGEKPPILRRTPSPIAVAF